MQIRFDGKRALVTGAGKGIGREIATLPAKIPRGRFARPKDAARSVGYLPSDQADVIHGAVLPIDGGLLAV